MGEELNCREAVLTPEALCWGPVGGGGGDMHIELHNFALGQGC